MTPRYLYLGIKGSVLAVNRDTGETIWERHLKGEEMVSVLVEDNRIFAGSRGELFCLNAATGEQLWHNDLPGMGYGLVCLATDAGNNAASLLQQGQQRDAATTAAIIAASS